MNTTKAKNVKTLNFNEEIYSQDQILLFKILWDKVHDSYVGLTNMTLNIILYIWFIYKSIHYTYYISCNIDRLTFVVDTYNYDYLRIYILDSSAYFYGVYFCIFYFILKRFIKRIIIAF